MYVYNNVAINDNNIYVYYRNTGTYVYIMVPNSRSIVIIKHCLGAHNNNIIIHVPAVDFYAGPADIKRRKRGRCVIDESEFIISNDNITLTDGISYLPLTLNRVYSVFLFLPIIIIIN